MKNDEIKTVIWVGTTKEELLEFPEEVIDEIGYILYGVQIHQTHPKIKPLKGFNGVFEIRSNYQTDTYRTVYAIKIDNDLYVLHAFKKKSPKGIKTPQQTINLIKQR
ncbi:MAG TPA: type II toxin-antitoxin system RelE/ParE family toxin, partial [Allocoleopsis sp.]